MDQNYENAQRRYDRELPDDLPEVETDRLTPTLAMQIADYIEAGGRERLLAVADFLIDEMGLPNYDDPVSTFAHWTEGGTGPRDLDFDARR